MSSSALSSPDLFINSVSSVRMSYGLDMWDSDLDVCVEVPRQPPSLTEWVTEKFTKLLQSRERVEEVKLCEWKLTHEMKYRGRWCDIMFSMSAQKETAVRESRSLKDRRGRADLEGLPRTDTIFRLHRLRHC